MNDFIVKELNASTWNDFETLFLKHKGVRGGCWCVYHKMTMGEFIQSTREQRQQLHKDLVMQGKTNGILVYDHGVPIAWCQYGRAETFASSYDHVRDYGRLAIPSELKPGWRITCLFVDKDRRKEGWSRIALQAAVQSIASQGGGIIEAFPLDIPGAKRPSYTGSVKMYEELGFKVIAPIGKYNFLVRVKL
jgi:GNAT superfamily N-acetyltransferase